MDIKVSVIIPVYNGEKYLACCIESLLNQNLEECEFIFINDGSIDKSREIIESYKLIDTRVKLINQKNKGVSAARNHGLKIAAGDYVGFVDADDYIEKDMFERLYNVAKQKNRDVIISNFESEIERHKVITTYPFPKSKEINSRYIRDYILPYFLESDNLNTACNKIYKLKLIRSNHIKFPESLALGEDGMFNMQFFSSAENAEYINYTGYHYREVKGSATKNILENDYFQRALDVYKLELPKELTGNIEEIDIRTRKSIKLIKSVMSYVHVYFTPSKEISYKNRYQYIKRMVTDQSVRESLPFYLEEKYNNLGRYEKILLNLIKKKLILGLYCITTYSRIRNKKVEVIR